MEVYFIYLNNIKGPNCNTKYSPNDHHSYLGLSSLPCTQASKPFVDDTLRTLSAIDRASGVQPILLSGLTFLRSPSWERHQTHSSSFCAQYLGNMGSALIPIATRRFLNMDIRLKTALGRTSKSISSLGSLHNLRTKMVLNKFV